MRNNTNNNSYRSDDIPNQGKIKGRGRHAPPRNEDLGKNKDRHPVSSISSERVSKSYGDQQNTPKSKTQDRRKVE